MPPELTIAPVLPAAPQAHLRPPAQAAAVQVVFSADTSVGATPSAPSQVARAPSTPNTAIPENRVVLDPSSDRVVLEYFDATGTLINSLPSQRQLDAYRLAAASSASSGTNIKKL